jgi:hypothetical protein
MGWLPPLSSISKLRLLRPWCYWDGQPGWETIGYHKVHHQVDALSSRQ